MSGVLGLIVLASSLLVVAQCGEYCTTSDTGLFYQYEYCSWGCCGDWPNENCCASYLWIIIVGVIGGLIFLSCVIAVICCAVKQQGHRGQVVQPAQTTGVTTIAYATAPGVQPYNYGYPQPQPQPPAFGQPAAQPPAYGHPGSQPPQYSFPGQSGQDPAYPPPSASTTAKN